ncbi:MAG: hypothetical protein HY650_06705 [Acidobacteria bacterium]|nr:hypothetical protein [Acidobacteriota bacterium]
MALGRGCLRTGLTGCLGLILLVVIAGFGLFILSPGTFERGIEWGLYEPPPVAAEYDPSGSEQTERFFKTIFALSGRNDRLLGRAQLTESQVNDYLQDLLGRSVNLKGLKEVRVVFMSSRIDLFATLDPSEMERDSEFRELERRLPAPLRGYKTSFHIRLEDPQILDRRFSFRQVSMYVGRLPVPIPVSDLTPLLKLLPGGELAAASFARGIPLPHNTRVTILPSKIQVAPDH